MKKIDLIIKKIIDKRKIKVIKKTKKRTISNGIIYEINIELKQKNKVSIYSKWNMGLLGKLIFKSIFEEKNVLYNKLKKEILEEGFVLDEINLIT